MFVATIFQHCVDNSTKRLTEVAIAKWNVYNNYLHVLYLRYTHIFDIYLQVLQIYVGLKGFKIYMYMYNTLQKKVNSVVVFRTGVYCL